VDDSGADVGFTACDPGKNAAAPPAFRLDNAEQVLGVRYGLTEAFAKGGNDGDYARCVARMLVGKPGLVTLVMTIGNNEPTPAQTAQLRPLVLASESACHQDSDAGLP
jgi:hypothetical protein